LLLNPPDRFLRLLGELLGDDLERMGDSPPDDFDLE